MSEGDLRRAHLSRVSRLPFLEGAQRYQQESVLKVQVKAHPQDTPWLWDTPLGPLNDGLASFRHWRGSGQAKICGRKTVRLPSQPAPTFSIATHIACFSVLPSNFPPPIVL
uniref:Uncharacterized protein n=1 Tax=Sphaerodactylus townsendi TaxID=933632 RepID=A0ACB8E7S4_9SAUR